MEYHLNFTLIWRHFGRLAWGLLLSLELSVLAIVVGVVLGFALALVHVSGPRWARRIVVVYVEVVRNTPLLLLVYLVFYGVPTILPLDYSASTSFTATLALYSAAYLVEVFRAGLVAIGPGLLDAGRAIGLTAWQRLLWVRLPLVIRIVLPSLSNTFVSLFKDTSVASVLSVPELTYGAQWINFNTFRIVEVYLVVAPMYVVTGYVILLALRQVERRLALR